MIRFNALESLGLSVAAMSDRTDGDCRLPSQSNGFAGSDARRAFLESLALDPDKLVCMRQIHGTTVTAVSIKDCGRGGFDAADALADSDAIITSDLGLPIGVSVADCVPLIMFDPIARATAVVHAGRLGTMGNIVGCVVDAMQAHFDSESKNLNVIIGASAGPQRYEVSEGIASEFAALGLPRHGRMLDLWGANRIQCERAGVPGPQIHVQGHCTISDDQYFSHRQDGSGDRNLAVAAL